jgi:hypothetical protein
VHHHRFAVGQSVTFSETRFPNLISGAECVIVRLLPTLHKGPEYAIRCPRVAFELVVGEMEITATDPSRDEDMGNSFKRLAA